MHQVISATTNPAKIQAILQAFEEIFGEGSCHITPVAVESGVPEQPFGSEETRAGARNRVDNARRLHPQADFWIGRKEGAIGVFTAGKLTRSSVYYQAVILALSPFHNAVYR
ncbi:DUF84 family protein [Salmonella enterica]|uniref:DUF84 family protein n=1 Tax=Salmonella enterica TaxID=28901 RepID=UPI0030D5C957